MEGCTHSQASNYDPQAEEEDFSCTFYFLESITIFKADTSVANPAPETPEHSNDTEFPDLQIRLLEDDLLLHL